MSGSLRVKPDAETQPAPQCRQLGLKDLGFHESGNSQRIETFITRLWGYWWPKGVALPEAATIEVAEQDGHPAGKVT